MGRNLGAGNLQCCVHKICVLASSVHPIVTFIFCFDDFQGQSLGGMAYGICLQQFLDLGKRFSSALQCCLFSNWNMLKKICNPDGGSH